MTYNFRDEPAPAMAAEIDSAGGLSLRGGSPQGNLITEAFTGSDISVSIVPPRGWSLDSVVWPNGGGGTLTVPAAGQEETHPFTYTVSLDGTSLTDSGQFKIKNSGSGG